MSEWIAPLDASSRDKKTERRRKKPQPTPPLQSPDRGFLPHEVGKSLELKDGQSFRTPQYLGTPSIGY